jgi:CheY-like chemotaxis protein
MKQVALGSSMFKNITLARDLPSALKLLKETTDNSYDTVLSSLRFPVNLLLEFAKTLHSREIKFSGAHITVLPGSVNTQSIKEEIMSKINGFLLEPYGVSDLEEMFQLSQNVRRAKEKKKLVAKSILLNQSLIQIEALSSEFTQNKNILSNNKNNLLSAITSASLKISKNNISEYQRVVTEKIVEDAKPIAVVGSQGTDRSLSLRSYSNALTKSLNDFSLVENSKINDILSKMNLPLSYKNQVTEGILRVKGLLEEQNIVIDIKEAVLPNTLADNDPDENEILKRLQAKLESTVARRNLEE